MASTFLSLHYHIVFSTKKTACRSSTQHGGGDSTNISAARSRASTGFRNKSNGVADHVHLLVGLKATHCLADFMRELKKSSSAWVHDELRESKFSWQEVCRVHGLADRPE